MKTLEALIEESKKEFEEKFKNTNYGYFLTHAKAIDELELFLETQMRRAYSEGRKSIPECCFKECSFHSQQRQLNQLTENTVTKVTNVKEKE